jgi:hypothetical protein
MIGIYGKKKEIESFLPHVTQISYELSEIADHVARDWSMRKSSVGHRLSL